MRKLVNLLCFLFIFSTFLGCGAELLISPVITGIIYWKNGEAHKYYEYDSGAVYKASKRALEQMDQIIVKDTNNSDNYSITAGNGDKFKITIEPVQKNISKLSIRINCMGDKPYAELFYKYVDDQLNVIQFEDTL